MDQTGLTTKINTMTETITIMPETSGSTLCLRLQGVISAEDFTRNFGDRVRDIVATHGHYNLYILYDQEFKGWSCEAADLSFKNISQYSPKASRLAYVNAPDSRILMMKMLEPIMQAEIRYFNLAEKDEALAWVQQAP